MSKENSYDVLHSLPEIQAKDIKDAEEKISIVVTPEELPVATIEQAAKTTKELKNAKSSQVKPQTGIEVATIDVDTQFTNNGQEINENEQEQENER